MFTTILVGFFFSSKAFRLLPMNEMEEFMPPKIAFTTQIAHHFAASNIRNENDVCVHLH